MRPYYTHKRRSRPPHDSLHVLWVSDTHLHDEAHDDPDFPTLVNPDMHFHTAAGKLRHVVAQANALRPDYVVHTGDIVHSSGLNSGYDTFREIWDNLEVPSVIVPGNHDGSGRRQNNELGLSAHDYLAKKLGYDTKPKNAGSKFNQSLKLGYVRVIAIDTNINPDTGELDSAGGYFSPALLSWIDAELRSSPEQICTIWMHHGPRYAKGTGQQDFYNMLRSVKDETGKLIYHFFGHSHTRYNRIRFTAGEDLPEYETMALIDRAVGEFLSVYIAPNGAVTLRRRVARWPYP